MPPMICSRLLALVTATAMCPLWRACADPLPTIVTYELAEARRAADAAARDPRGFWVGQIVARLEERKPDRQHSVKRPVTVELGFVVDRAGRLLSKQLARSSGDPAIDAEAIAVLDRAAPFPPMPAALPGDHLVFTVPLRFR